MIDFGKYYNKSNFCDKKDNIKVLDVNSENIDVVYIKMMVLIFKKRKFGWV